MISITQLKYLLAVHDQGHFGKAAEVCNVAQPTLSAQVRKAEEQLGFAVFARNTKPVSVTRQGRAVVSEARGVIDAYERFRQLARGKFEELSGELIIGVIPTLAPYLVPLFLKSFAEAYPLVDMTIVVKTTSEIIAGLRSRQLGAGLLATPLDEDGLTERPLFAEQFYVYAASGESLLSREEVKPEALDRQKLWLLSEGHCLRNQALSVCQGIKGCSFLPTVRFEASSLETVQHLVDMSGGYTLVPECYARLMSREQQSEQLRSFVEPAPCREISLMYPQNDHQPELVNALWSAVSDCLPLALKQRSVGPEARARVSPR